MLRYGAADTLRRLFRRRPPEALREDEFWALHDVNFTVHPGECLGIIGPNGAGKSTLLKLIHGDYRPDQGRVTRQGATTALIRLGGGLQPLLTGRENIYIQCMQRGFTSAETDALLDSIAAFSGLEKALDLPLKRYSDGMYARLEFSIATCAPMDILLIDEVLAVGDAAFQMRCLRRLEQLKRAGTAILLVSHAEMNIRRIADRCLLLFDGEALALGETDALFRQYYAATGFLDKPLEPLGLAPAMPETFAGAVTLTDASSTIRNPPGRGTITATTGKPLRLVLHYRSTLEAGSAANLVLQFWSAAGLLMASFESGLNGGPHRLEQAGVARLDMPFLGLTAGVYRVAGGFQTGGGQWLGYQSCLLTLHVCQPALPAGQGLLALHGRVTLA